MTHRRLVALALALSAGPAAAASAAPAGAPAAKPVETYVYLKLPLLSDRVATTPVAVVDGEPVTLAQLNEAIAESHGSRTGDSHAAGRDVGPVLDRLLTVRLFVSEARETGLDEQPAFVNAVAEFKEKQLRQLAEVRATKEVRPDALEVERLYRDATREWKIRSLLFGRKEDAVGFRAAIAGGKPFAELAREAIASKKATGNEAADWVGRSQLLPQIADAVSRIERAPATTDPVEVKGGFAVATVEEVRYPDDPRAKAAAEASSRERLRAAKLERYRQDLQKKFARIDQKLWRGLDFEAAKPGFAALAKDKRPIVTIKGGGKPVTVADVAAEMERWFFHGVDEPIKEKRLNAAKDDVLHKVLTRRLYLHAGRQAGIPSSPEYTRAVAEYEDSLLFGAYVQTVIAPDVKVTEEEGKGYYERHKAEFTLPAFYKLEALAFGTPQAASAAAKKLAAGTDYGFVRANAEGQVKGDDRALALDGQTVSANTLPPDLARELSGAKRDDVRTFTTGGQTFVVHVIDVTPAKEQPYLEARPAIGKKLAAENLDKAVKDIAAKLRASHQVAIYLDRIGN